MPRFGFTQEEMDELKDAPIVLEGTNDVGVVLLHGWTSYPRQVRTLADFLHQQGYWVTVPMLPGHGTMPEDLENVSWLDWISQAERSVLEMKRNAAIRQVVVGGTSMGGSLALLASLKVSVAGIVLIGTPVHLRNHFLVWLGTFIPSWLKKYQKKNYPAKVRKEKNALGYTSYKYFPIKSVHDCLVVIRKAVFSLPKVTAPTLILQTNTDYLVAKYSPWVIYNAIGSKVKLLEWIKTENNSHIVITEDSVEFLTTIKNFIERVTH